jgi:periodic tryptophan protein 1
LERVAALARIELEDARVELERAHKAAKGMADRALDDDGGEGDNADWVECVPNFFSTYSLIG